METSSIKLNLANIKRTNIQYKISRFPDGQQTVDITSHLSGFSNLPVTIISRLNNFKDLEIILCATAGLKEIGFDNISLYTPYFIGARSDRKFQDGGINYLKTVICPIINAQGYKKVTILDPHSSVLEACLNNFKEIDNTDFVNEVLNDGSDYPSELDSDNYVLVSPDAGALKKVFKVQQKFGINDMLIGAKNRDVNGQITHTSISGDLQNADLANKTFLIIDDICDGGRTFIELAKVIKATHKDAKIHLLITHGIFTKGLEPLAPYFSKIFTTNSVKAAPIPNLVEVIDVFNF
jgi:ribose-phosphate pyrophosphokinase